MLTDQIKDTLIEIKFKPELVDRFSAMAKDFPAKLLISGNAFQKESRLNKPFGIVFTVNPAKVADVLVVLNEDLPQSYKIYILSETNDSHEIAVVRPTDKYELLRIMGTNSEEKHDLDTGTLVARLRRWEEEIGLEIIGAGTDWVKFSFEHIPGNLRDFTNEVLTFAPATAGELSIVDFEKNIRENKKLHLRW